MARRTSTKAFRFYCEDVLMIENLAERLRLSHTDVVRLAIRELSANCPTSVRRGAFSPRQRLPVAAVSPCEPNAPVIGDIDDTDSAMDEWSGEFEQLLAQYGGEHCEGAHGRQRLYP